MDGAAHQIHAVKTIINLKRFLHPQKNLKFQGDKIPEREEFEICRRLSGQVILKLS